MTQSLEALEQMYESAQDNLDDMLAACPDQTHRDEVEARYESVRKNYLDALTRSFEDDEPALQVLVAKAQSVTREIKDIDEHLGDIARVLNVLEEAASIGAQIVSMGTAAA